MALAGFGVMPWEDEAEDDGMFGGMLVAEADDDGHVVSYRATPPCFFHAMLSHALTMPSPWHCDALLLMIVSVLRSLPAQRQAVFNGEAKAGRNDGRRAKGNDPGPRGAGRLSAGSESGVSREGRTFRCCSAVSCRNPSVRVTYCPRDTDAATSPALASLSLPHRVC